MAFQSLPTGASALIASGCGLDVVGQNRANIDIPGYSRQTINQAATKSWTPAIGNSVPGNKDWAASIIRTGNEYLEKRLRQAASTDKYYGSLQNCYRNIQSVFDELTGNGLSCPLNKFWNSMADVSTHVKMLTARKTAIADAVGMTQRFNRLSQQLTAARRDTDEAIAASVTQINQLLKFIAQHNRDMVNSKLDGASDRMANDSENPLIEELYQYMDVDAIEEENGSFTISLHGHRLVYFDQVKEIGVEKTISGDGAMVNTPVFASGNYPFFPMEGLLAAQLKQRDVIIPSYQEEMDTLATNFIWEFNRIYLRLEPDQADPGIFEISIDSEHHTNIKSNTENYDYCSAEDVSGILAALGLNVFFTSHAAASMGVNDVSGNNPSLLGSARSFSREDGGATANIPFLPYKGLSGIGEMTLDEYYRSVIERLASEAGDNANMWHLSRDIYNRLFVQRETLSGVNEDGVALKMLSCQCAFQSATKFSSTVGQLYETLLNV